MRGTRPTRRPGRGAGEPPARDVATAITLRAPRGLLRLAPALRLLVRAALEGEDRRAREIGIVLADDAELRALNRWWRGIDRATDVLSFSYDERSGNQDGRAAPVVRHSRDVSGDLVISMDRVLAQARRYRVSRGREPARLVVHGALHLAGLDHQRPAERNRMRRREARALATAAAAVRILKRRLQPGRRD